MNVAAFKKRIQDKANITTYKMVYTNTLSVCILHHHENITCNKNIFSIQEIMRTSKPAFKKYKNFCSNFSSLAILTKNATLDKVQLKFAHTYVGDKYLREFVAAVSLSVSLDSPSVFSININLPFATDRDSIFLPITEVLICTAAGDLAQSKKQYYWTPLNAFLFPPFLMEAAILDRGSDTGELLCIFACSVTERAEAGEEDGGDNKDNKDDDDSEGGMESEKHKKIRR